MRIKQIVISKNSSIIRVLNYSLVSANMKLSRNLDQATLNAKEILKDKKNVQVKFSVKRNGVEIETSAIYLRKISPERIEQLKKELIQRFPDGEFSEINMLISKIPARKAKCPNCAKIMFSYNLKRHLGTCIKGEYCPICQKDFEGELSKHIEECGVRYYTCTVCGERFNTGGRRTAHEKKCKVIKEATTQTAIGGLFKIIEIKPPPSPDYKGLLRDQTKHIADILNHEIKHTLKFYISMEVELSLDGESKIANFQSQATLLNRTMNFEEQVNTHKEVLTQKIEEYCRMGSGWEMENVNTINIMVTHIH